MRLSPGRRLPLIRATLLLPLLLPIAGCGESETGDFRAYSELEPAGQQATAEPAAAGEPRPAAEPVAEPETAATEDAAVPKKDAATDSTPASPAAVATTDDDAPAEEPVAGTPVREPVVAPLPGAVETRVMARVPVREPVAAPRPGPEDLPAAPVVKRTPKVLVPNQTFRTEGPEGAIRVTYDDIDLLKVLNMDPVTAEAPEMMPDWLKDLDGRRIRLRGFMYPPFEETGIEVFALARDNQICCFGKNPKIYDLFPVFLRKGHTTNYILNRPFDVVGVFHIDPTFDEETGKARELYLIDDAIVIDQ